MVLVAIVKTMRSKVKRKQKLQEDLQKKQKRSVKERVFVEFSSSRKTHQK